MGIFNNFFGVKKNKIESKEEAFNKIDVDEEKKLEDVIEKKSEVEKISDENISNEEDLFLEKEETFEENENLRSNNECKIFHEETENLDKEKIKEDEKGFFTNLKEKLFKTREGLFGKIKNLFSGKTKIDKELYEELEELLIQSDIGFDMTSKIVTSLEKEVENRKITDPVEIYAVLKNVMGNFLIDDGIDLDIRNCELNVILVVGVNGVGKTTTIGKLSNKFQNEGKKIIVGAADTFRAAAIEQLEEWGKRANVEIVKKEQGSDPGAVTFEAIQVAQDKKADILIIDTAGRLHNKSNLMKELEKINNVIEKKLGHNRYETILVIDGTTGQNGLSQAKVFNEVTRLSGFIVTKLDGTAKGGIVFSISDEIKKPIKYIGVGEKIEDLRKFNKKEYIDAIFD